jgi:hypothetical protein
MSDWKKFARNLNFPDHKMDEIENENRKIEDQVSKMIKFLKDCNQFNWPVVKDILMKIPRVDIIRSLEKSFPELK